MADKYLSSPGASEVFQTARNILGYDLLKLCREGELFILVNLKLLIMEYLIFIPCLSHFVNCNWMLSLFFSTYVFVSGPENVLKLTYYCQPAVMATSLAALHWLKEKDPPVRSVAQTFLKSKTFWLLNHFTLILSQLKSYDLYWSREFMSIIFVTSPWHITRDLWRHVACDVIHARLLSDVSLQPGSVWAS